MIQILGLRTYTDKRGTERPTDAFHEKGWRVSDIYELFNNPEKYLDMVPEDQRWNLFYTVANCTDEKRVFQRQDVLPIDVDGIDKGTEQKIVDVICEELGLPKEKLGIVFSGNGVHILIGLKNPILDVTYLRVNKPYYRALCGRINTALFQAGLKGSADPVVFSESRLLRMPFTDNVKKGKANTKCTLINGYIEPLDVDLFTLSDIPQVGEGEHIHPRAYGRMPTPDTDAVLSQCGFLKHCKETDKHEHDGGVNEPMWYAMLSIVGRLENGEKLALEYSEPKGMKHSKYISGSEENALRVENKLKHALEASGPRTCQNISSMWEGCKSCPHFGKITSPIQIVSEDTIRTAETGFYNIIIKNGIPAQGKPNYDDLERHFRKQHNYITVSGIDQVMLWNGTHWEEAPRSYLHSYAEKHFDPTPTNAMCCEFESKLKRCNVKSPDFTIVTDKLNFKNGVLNLETEEIEPHSQEYGFTYTIPYDYAPTGDCPTFKKFIQDVTCGDAQLVELITEYMGYCLSGADPVLVQKCAILHGDGSNGKSVLIGLMRDLVGGANCSSVSIDSLRKEQYRYHLMHKMFNVSDEAPTDSFVNSAVFKAMVSGDEVEVRRLYQEPSMWKCTTKMMFACNELPYSGDYSYGMFRRLIIIPFNQTFSARLGNRDPFILEKLKLEKSDIFKLCLDKWKNVKKRGYNFIESSASEDELADYAHNSDVIARFIYNACDKKMDNNTVMSLDVIYNAFAIWCMDNQQKTIPYGAFAKRFGNKISQRFPDIQKTRPRLESGGRTIGFKNLVVNTTQVENNF